MGEVTISVAGRAYQVVCEDGEEDRLTAIAARVDQEAQAFGGATPSLSEPRLLLMCALLLADKLDELEASPQVAASPAPESSVPTEVDASAVDEATARIDALAQAGGSGDAGLETEPDVSPEPVEQAERPSKSSAAVAAEKDLLSWADRSETRQEAEEEPEAEAADDIAPDPAPVSEDAGPVETDAEREARERSERRRRRRERLARLANEAGDDA